MANKSWLLITLVAAALGVGAAAHAQEHHEEMHGAPPPQHMAPPSHRAPPPAFRAHAPGPHPRGPTMQSHPVRVLSARVVVRGQRPWTHWAHPEFARPTYYWSWGEIHGVSCTAEDSYGDQYPVSQTAAPGFGLDNMTEVEDDALDRCYSESGSDQSCVLATCTHY